jgi:hypothetical protein
LEVIPIFSLYFRKPFSAKISAKEFDLVQASANVRRGESLIGKALAYLQNLQLLKDKSFLGILNKNIQLVKYRTCLVKKIYNYLKISKSRSVTILVDHTVGGRNEIDLE